ncbi:lipid A biosynthesis acyltransferase [Sphingobacteriaceae bacterium]|nr:lipid A biosynthesis acyltransferase [Sphingobacteriaceae bacterium]
MPENSKWEGKTRGGLSGHKIFVFILNTFGLPVAYFFLRFVAFYFFLFTKSTKTALKYFREIHEYKGLKAYRATYQNYFLFGQILLDKVALLSGVKTNFTIEHDGHAENLESLKTSGKGSILLSAHIGNWEIAGQMLNSLDTKFNVLMYDNEAEKMKEYMSKVMGKKSFNVIAIRDGDMSHLIELHRAFSNNELVVMHGDRFLPGTATIEKNFMGKPAKFPSGPFIMAAKFGVPVTLVFAVKETKTHYHFFARKPIEMKRARTKEDMELAVKTGSDQYIKELEFMLKKYPTQWFNFYDFWK